MTGAQTLTGGGRIGASVVQPSTACLSSLGFPGVNPLVLEPAIDGESIGNARARAYTEKATAYTEKATAKIHVEVRMKSILKSRVLWSAKAKTRSSMRKSGELGGWWWWRWWRRVWVTNRCKKLIRSTVQPQQSLACNSSRKLQSRLHFDEAVLQVDVRAIQCESVVSYLLKDKMLLLSHLVRPCCIISNVAF